MIQPNFNPLFYSKFIFGLTKIAGAETKEPTAAGPVELNFYEEKAKAILSFKNFRNAQKNEILKTFKDKGVNPTVFGSKKERRAFMEFSSINDEMAKGYEKFTQFLDSPSVKNAKPEDRKKMIKEKLKAIKTVFDGFKERAKEFHLIEQKREEMLLALKKQKEIVRAYFKKFFKESLTKEQQEKVVWFDLSKLIDAYMDRWVKENDDAINKLSGKQVKFLHNDLGNGIFERGILKQNVDEINGQILTIITKYWLEGREREVYKDSNWTNEYEHEQDMRMGRKRVNLKMVPFPDGKDFAPEKGKKPYVSPLEEKYLAQLEQKEAKKMNAVLASRSKLIDEFKKMGGIIEEFHPWEEDLSNLAKQCGYPKPYVSAFILQNWGNSEKKTEYMPIMMKEVEILHSAIKYRTEFQKEVAIRNSLAKQLRDKGVTADEILSSPLFKKDFAGKEEVYKNVDNVLTYVILNKNLIASFGEGVKGLAEVAKSEAVLFKDVLSRIKEYKIQPTVVLKGSKLDVQIKGKDIPKPIQDKIVKGLQGALKVDIQSKYADTNVSLNGASGYKMLLENNLKSIGIPGRIAIENPSVNVTELPKNATATGYASFDSRENDYKRNYEQYALGRAKKLGVKGAKLVGKVMGVDSKGECVAIDPKKGNAGVKESWKNATVQYQKLAKEKKLSEGKETEMDLRKLVAEYNKGGTGFKPEQKAFFDKYFGQWRKAELDLTKSDKDHKFEINVKFV